MFLFLTEIVLKVALNTITLTPTYSWFFPTDYIDHCFVYRQGDMFIVTCKLLKQDDVFPHFFSQIQNEISVYNND
jgi:hypothetical protein